MTPAATAVKKRSKDSKVVVVTEPGEVIEEGVDQSPNGKHVDLSAGSNGAEPANQRPSSTQEDTRSDLKGGTMNGVHTVAEIDHLRKHLAELKEELAGACAQRDEYCADLKWLKRGAVTLPVHPQVAAPTAEHLQQVESLKGQVARQRTLLQDAQVHETGLMEQLQESLQQIETMEHQVARADEERVARESTLHDRERELRVLEQKVAALEAEKAEALEKLQSQNKQSCKCCVQ